MKKIKSFISSPFGTSVICAVLAGIGGVCITPFSGVATALPILAACAILSGFLNINFLGKTAIFAAVGGFVYGGYSGKVTDIVVFALVCGLAALFSHFSVSLFKSDKYRFWGIIPLAAVCALQLAFGGNIIEYNNAKTVSEAYLEAHYDGEHETIGKLEYHYTNRTWQIEVSSLPTPYITGNLVVSDKVVFDNYKAQVERYLISDTRTEIANALRKHFPSGSFTVKSVEILGYPSGDVYITDSENYTDRGVFAVYLGELTDKNGFLKTASHYREALKFEGIEVGRIIFRGGGLGIYPMEEVNFGIPFVESKVKYNCGSVFATLQQDLDRYFIKNIFVY